MAVNGLGVHFHACTYAVLCVSISLSFFFSSSFLDRPYVREKLLDVAAVGAELLVAPSHHSAIDANSRESAAGGLNLLDVLIATKFRIFRLLPHK